MATSVKVGMDFFRDRAYEMFHLGKFLFSRARGKFGCIVISIDFELIREDLIEREIAGFNSLLRFSHDYNLPMTFAVVGKVIEENPACIEQIKSANVRNEIGSHSYSHKLFDEISRQEAEIEVKKSVEVLNKHGVKPVSFVFAKNAANYLDLLPRYGFKCYRSFFDEKNVLACPRKINGLWNIPQSLFLCSRREPWALVKMADMARRKKLVFHIWCHPYNWGVPENTYNGVMRVLVPLVNYSKKRGLEFKTMGEVAENWGQ